MPSTPNITQRQRSRHEFQKFVKSVEVPMTPWQPDMDMSGISVSESDTLEEGGIIAYNPAKPFDQWYVAAAYFRDNYAPVDSNTELQAYRRTIAELNREIAELRAILGRELSDEDKVRAGEHR